MIKLQTLYKNPLFISAASIIIGIVIGFTVKQTKVYVEIPYKLTVLDSRLQQVEMKQEKQEERDEYQDIEIRLNQAETNQVKIEMAEFGANMENMLRLQGEMNVDVKKLLIRE